MRRRANYGLTLSTDSCSAAIKALRLRRVQGANIARALGVLGGAAVTSGKSRCTPPKELTKVEFETGRWELGATVSGPQRSLGIFQKGSEYRVMPLHRDKRDRFGPWTDKAGTILLGGDGQRLRVYPYDEDLFEGRFAPPANFVPTALVQVGERLRVFGNDGVELSARDDYEVTSIRREGDAVIYSWPEPDKARPNPERSVRIEIP